MANPRIEEVDDDDFADDPEEMDLDAFDFARPQKGNLGPTGPNDDDDDDDEDDDDDDVAAAAGLSPQDMQKLMQNAQATGNMPRFSEADRERLQREQQAQSKHFQCIYPVYFDSSRSREDGRRVSKSDATPNPLARDIVDALQHIGQTKGVPLQIVFEPTKTHPKDWANPGRVKVLLKKDGKPVSAKISNKSYLYKLIASYLKSHPTTTASPMRFRIQGMPMPKDNKILPPAVPRGSKINQILPLHSPALSGGGVSDNFLQDVMAEMGGQLPPGINPDMMAALGGMGGGMGGAGAGGSVKKVKEKKKK